MVRKIAEYAALPTALILALTLTNHNPNPNFNQGIPLAPQQNIFPATDLSHTNGDCCPTGVSIHIPLQILP